MAAPQIYCHTVRNGYAALSLPVREIVAHGQIWTERAIGDGACGWRRRRRLRQQQ